MSTLLGEKVKALRKEKGMSLDTLAAAASMSKSYLWELENRDSPRPSAEKLAALAKALDMSASFFIEDEVVAPDASHLDQAFFRNYNRLGSSEKEQLHAILKTFLKPK